MTDVSQAACYYFNKLRRKAEKVKSAQKWKEEGKNKKHTKMIKSYKRIFILMVTNKTQKKNRDPANE